MNSLSRLATLLGAVGAITSAGVQTAAAKESLNVLFIGNSYTARHNLAKVVKSIAEAGNPGLTFNISSVIYGGRTLADHWRFGTQHVVNQHAVTKTEIEATVAALQKAAKDPKDRYAKGALGKQKRLLAEYESKRSKWDIIVLQSYRDDLKGADSRYMKYAPKYAGLAKTQGARVILYVTTPSTQNAKPIESMPDKSPILKKAKSVAKLADAIGADVAPISLVAQRCQTQRPDFTLRFINDAHLNKTLAYLSACTIYSAIFHKSPEGLPIDSITDIRFLGNDKTKDRDGQPITLKFSSKDQADLQRIAWESWQEFQSLRSK
ncbi:MAG: hypothetical protein ACJASX_000839 [Limisphaerales bacterium]|jgi:hypothetical protein